jgi:hypothetical protein
MLKLSVQQQSIVFLRASGGNSTSALQIDPLDREEVQGEGFI